MRLSGRWGHDGEPFMSKKKSASSRSKLASFRNARKPVAKRNSPGGGPIANVADAATGLAMMVGPGIGGYAATRLGGKFARVLLGKRLAGGRFEKHFGPLGSIATLLAIWYAAHKWEKARKYQEPALIGSAIALFQSLLSTYLPGLVGLIDGQPAVSGFAATGAINGFRNGMNGRRRRGNGGIRYVSPGELESERIVEEEREDRGDADEVTSQSQQVEDEQAPEEADSPLSDESADIQEFVAENEHLSGLYDGVFSKAN